MKRTSSFKKCNRCKNQIGYDLMTIGTLRTQAVLFLYCNNCGEKNMRVETEGEILDENQLNLFKDEVL